MVVVVGEWGIVGVGVVVVVVPDGVMDLGLMLTVSRVVLLLLLLLLFCCSAACGLHTPCTLLFLY